MAPTSGQLPPPSPEEPPEIAEARRERIQGLISGIQASIIAAQNSVALFAMWAEDETKRDLAEVESAGAKGKDAAYALRSKFMTKADRLKDAESQL